jgi:sugar phosphate isomerase/epimerase
MPKPTPSWMPVRLLSGDTAEASLVSFDWLETARHFGFSAIDLHWRFLGGRETDVIEKLAARLHDTGLQVSMLSCFPDLANPHPSTRRQQMSEVEMTLEIAHRLGAHMLMLSPGEVHAGVDDEYAATLVEESLLGLTEFASPLGVRLVLGNFRQNRAASERSRFAATNAAFLKLYERVKTLAVWIDFDCSSPLLEGDDPVELLEGIKDRLINIHASDRRPGESRHTSLGDGAVSFDRIFGILAEAGYAGYISVVDDSPEGEVGLESSLAFLHRMIDKFWPDP